MEINITVGDITLDTVVGKVLGFDEDGDPYTTGETRVADLVADRIVDRLAKDDRYPKLRDLVLEVRKEEIRAAVLPSIQEALTRPIRKTNHYGEVTGSETTLSEMIADEARKQLNEPSDRYNRENGTLLSKTVAAEVKKAVGEEIAAAVKQVRDQVTRQLGTEVGEQIAAILTGAIKR